MTYFFFLMPTSYLFPKCYFFLNYIMGTCFGLSYDIIRGVFILLNTTKNLIHNIHLQYYAPSGTVNPYDLDSNGQSTASIGLRPKIRMNQKIFHYSGHFSKRNPLRNYFNFGLPQQQECSGTSMQAMECYCAETSGTTKPQRSARKIIS